MAVGAHYTLEEKDIYVGATYANRLDWELYVYAITGNQLRYKVMTGPKSEAYCQCSISDFVRFTAVSRVA